MKNVKNKPIKGRNEANEVLTKLLNKLTESEKKLAASENSVCMLQNELDHQSSQKRNRKASLKSLKDHLLEAHKFPEGLALLQAVQSQRALNEAAATMQQGGACGSELISSAGSINVSGSGAQIKANMARAATAVQKRKSNSGSPSGNAPAPPPGVVPEKEKQSEARAPKPSTKRTLMQRAVEPAALAIAVGAVVTGVHEQVV
jgi:hypothetical protein